LNVGTLGHPWPVRVEVPQWVAEDKAKLELLHAVLIEQCNMMGSKPYPYLLHRAHETAVVRREEKDQVEQLLAMELRRVRAEIGDLHKDPRALPGVQRRKSNATAPSLEEGFVLTKQSHHHFQTTNVL
jgi:hypothetical protein